MKVRIRMIYVGRDMSRYLKGTDGCRLRTADDVGPMCSEKVCGGSSVNKNWLKYSYTFGFKPNPYPCPPGKLLGKKL